MRILGIQKDHNSSACLFIDNELVYYNQEERLSRVKKDSGLPMYTLKEICKICPEIDKVLITGYDALHGENLNIINVLPKIGFRYSDEFEMIPYYKAHHLMHASKAFYSSGFDEALVIVSDGHGSQYNLNNGEQAYETTSVFSVSYPDKYNLIYRRFYTTSKITDDLNVIWNNCLGLDRIERPRYLTNDTIIEIRNDFDKGFMYEGTSRSLGLDDEGGKMMSLQSYAQFEEDTPWVLDENNKFNMDIFFIDYLKKHKGFNLSRYNQMINDEIKVCFAAKVQKAFEKLTLELINEMLEKTQHTNIILTGGTALNIVANNYVRKELPENISMYVEPLCGDEGNCIGLCQYYIKNKLDRSDKHFKKPSIYIGGIDPIYNYNLKEGEIEIVDADNKLFVDLLLAGHIVSIFHGKSEAGPRALGNRSILFDPRIKNGKDIVNIVKGREYYRPFAAVVMAEKAKDWFDLDKIDESPYMMYAVDTLSDKKDIIPAVVHIDGTCRIQTVSSEQNSTLYDIISHFYQRTQIPLLLNTSFNLAGDPIVETVEDAIESLRCSMLEYLYLPDIKKLIYIKNKN